MSLILTEHRNKGVDSLLSSCYRVILMAGRDLYATRIETPPFHSKIIYSAAVNPSLPFEVV